jgi:hypothetical protein
MAGDAGDAVIKERDLRYVAEHAYVPEHMVGYGTAVSGAEPFFRNDFLSYVINGHLIFIGYSLGPTSPRQLEKALQNTISGSNPRRVTVISPAAPASADPESAQGVDSYYRLDVGSATTTQKVRNMITRAGRELEVRKTRIFREEHQRLAGKLTSRSAIEEGSRLIFSRIPRYLETSPTALLFEARNRQGDLVAFDVAEFGAREYAFYLFNFRCREHYVPGASDLLFSALLGEARERGKRYINMGLGMNDGVTFFKVKWGSSRFLAHQVFTWERKIDLLAALMGRR